MNPSLKKSIDLCCLGLLILVLLWQPYYLHQQINLFELGLYLPGIEAIHEGKVPYRDFFYLRGPWELYFPALILNLFGLRLDVLATYFYIGNVLTVLLAALIAYELIEKRWLLYSLVLVLVARTFPRVVFTYWGGMRYAWGLLSIWCLIKFLKTSRPGWIISAGILTAIAFLTSIEIGVSAFFASIITLALRKDFRRGVLPYFLSAGLSLILFFGYFFSQGALLDYWQTQWIVITKMMHTFIQSEPVPGNLGEVLKSLVVVTNKNFRQMTPVYCYAFFFVLWAYRWRQNKLSVLDWSALSVALYGLAVYVTGFRNLWSSVFEMSLQPEKIILFYLFIQAFFWMKEQQGRWNVVYRIVLVGVILSSFIFSITRLNKRFFSVRWAVYKITGKDTTTLKPLNKEPSHFIHFPRIQNMVIPSWQAEDLDQLGSFIDENVGLDEKVWMYPELGAMHFLLDRPWIEKQPIPILAWMDEDSFERYDQELRAHPPRFAIWNKKMPEYYERIHLSVAANRKKLETHVSFLNANYSMLTSTPSYNIYRLNR